MTDITVPEGLWSEADKTGSIVVWLYPDGAEVREGDVVAELMVEKVTFEIEAPASGTLRIAVEPEVPVEMGERLASIE
jgi:pyruvate/2-oxoglutarate dehydrogenase complex dihydrolipoamide acyltransferase (E2) component